MVVHISLVCFDIFSSCHFLCSNTSYCWVFSVVFTLLSRVPPENIPDIQTEETSGHMQSNQHRLDEKKTFCVVCQRFAKRHMVLYNLNVTHRICKAYSNCNRNHHKVSKVNNVVHFFLSLLTVMRYIYITSFGGLFLCVCSTNYSLEAELDRDSLQWLSLFIF